MDRRVLRFRGLIALLMRFPKFFFILLLASVCSAEQTKLIPNPFTNRLDYITSLSTGSLTGVAILNQSSLQAGASFYVTSGTVQSLLSVNGNINTYGDTFYNKGTGLDLYPPSGGGVAYVYNANAGESGVTIVASDGVTTSSLSVTTQIYTPKIKFAAKNGLLVYPDGVTVLSMPTNQDTFLGYNTNLVNSGGVFNTGIGVAAMPYPYTGNFNNCVGNSCMSGNLINAGENNNAMGYAALGSLRAGFYNNCMGGSSCNLLTDAYYNVGVGAYSLNKDVTGNGNSAIGYRSLFWTTGVYNIGIGYEAGTSSDTANANVTGDHNIYIGYESGQDLATQQTNSAAVGYHAYVHKSNSLQLGGQQGSGLEWTVLTSTLSVANHYNNAGKIAPNMGTCGTNPSVVGYDSAATITVGSGLTTACTMNFATAWTNIPTCVMTVNTSAVTGGITALSTTSITFSFSATLGGGIIYVQCIGRDT